MSKKLITLESNKYELKLDNFEGPLDLLVYLIDKNQMDIYKVIISDITDQYISYLQRQESLNLEIASEFLVMASTLLLLKSKGLLPNSVDDEAELAVQYGIMSIPTFILFENGKPTQKLVGIQEKETLENLLK